MTTLLIILFIAGLSAVAVMIIERGIKNAINYNNYEFIYDLCKAFIYESEVNSNNYKFIMKLLKCLGQMKHKNKEKTSILTVEFFQRFKVEAGKQVLKY